VAGPGDDFSATDAPAGSEAGESATAELRMPELPTVNTWTPPAEPVAEVVPVEPVPAPPEPARVVEPVPVPNFARDMKATLRTEKRKTEREIRQQRAKEEAAQKAEAQRQKTSFAEFQKQQGAKSTTKTSSSTAKADPGKRIDTKSLTKGVTGGAGATSAGAGGKALSAAERDRMEGYFAMLISRLRDSHEKPAGLSDLLNAEVQFTVAANGVISGARISRSSGNAEFDRSVLEAFSRVRMPARPDGKTTVERLIFRMREA
jgi:colicin import membrane protein